MRSISSHASLTIIQHQSSVRAFPAMRAQEWSPIQTPTLFTMFMCLPACLLSPSVSRVPVEPQKEQTKQTPHPNP
jgi:hypothetical protein